MTASSRSRWRSSRSPTRRGALRNGVPREPAYTGSVPGGVARPCRRADGTRLRDAIAGNRVVIRHAVVASARDVLGYCEVAHRAGAGPRSGRPARRRRHGDRGASRARLDADRRRRARGVPADGARRDALAGASELVLAVEDVARATAGLVATVGSLSTDPGAGNVVPGKARTHARRPAFRGRFRLRRPTRSGRGASVSARAAGSTLEWRRCSIHRPSGLDPGLRSPRARGPRARVCPSGESPSGAGHDAACWPHLARRRCCSSAAPAVSVTTRPRGRVSEEDVAVAVDVLERFVTLLAERQ